MSQSSRRSFGSDFKRFFLRGLAVLLPSVLTLWLMVKAYQFIDSAIAEPINKGIRLAAAHIPTLFPASSDWFPPSAEMLADHAAERGVASDDFAEMAALASELRMAEIDAWWAAHPWMNLLGLLVTIVTVYIAGRFVGGFLGRTIYRRLEKVLTAVPVIKQVYPYIKQLIDFLISEDKQKQFSRVVAVEYPRKGIWSVGFLTGSTLRAIAGKSPDSVTIFIPSSPTPFTGYTITAPRADIIDLPITVEEAIRFAVSGGVLVPEREVEREVDPATMGTSAADLPTDTEESSDEPGNA